ncbi:MAG: STAS domain-containing protein [Saccharospirillaceae bacterium]|nr:STAS domain-containing protein [Pseudomonadales bacterium]NRB80224.1 STAS domain-containing protein [Saccharospirillaceae bacterium]
MDTGKIMMAELNGSHVIKFVGDVRLTMCTTIEACLKTMFDKSEFNSVVVDLSETEGIDSTSLGLLAKISREAQSRTHQVPVMVSNNEDITRIVQSMGFEHLVYEITSGLNNDVQIDLEEVAMKPLDEQEAHAKVLEAHKLLMDLNQKNYDTFKDLVQTIESGH